MRFTSRQRMILEKLLQNDQVMTIREIADEIEVSTRTVHRELDDLKLVLDHYDLWLEKKIGIGVQLQGSSEKKEVLRLALMKETDDYLPEERKLIILCTLLEASEPIKLLSLAYDLKVTVSTVSHDLDEIETYIHKFGLKVIRKRGYGVEIQGPEAAKRRTITSLISENWNEFDLIGVIKDTIQTKSQHRISSASERLLGLIEQSKLLVVENALRDLEKDLPYPLADSAFIGLVIHLALAIERIEKGENILFDPEYLNQLAGTQEYQAAEKILLRLESLLDLKIPRTEVGYITMHLRGAKVRNSYQVVHLSDNVELMAQVNQLIEACSQKLHVDFSNDPSLLQGLMTHMEPALFRLQQDMHIRNPLLEQIRRDYHTLFEILQEAVQEVFPRLDIPDEEIGYLAMHFGASLERLHRDHAHFRALIVCSSGIGSSKILASRISKELPQIEDLRNISFFELSSIPKADYDLIISTIPLPYKRDEYILVSPLLNNEDIQQIKSYLRDVQVTWSTTRALVEIRSANQTIEQLKSLQVSLSYVTTILEGFQFKTVSQYEYSLEEALREICQELEKRELITDKEGVIYQLLEREKLGGLGIPKTKLALFHSRNECIQKASFGIYRLSQPLLIRSMDNDPLSVTTILMLLGPKQLPREGLEILSEISSLFIEEEAIQLFESNQENLMFTYLAQKLQNHTFRKIRVEEQT